MFPEFRDLVVQLRDENPHFARIFEEHDELDREIIQLELDPVNLHNGDIESIKRKKLKLNDEIYRLLKGSSNDEMS